MTQDTSISEDIPFIQEARVWQGEGWTARVINNDDDDGWAMNSNCTPACTKAWS